MLAELSRREKAANIMPDPDIDIFMKVRKKLLSLTYSQPQKMIGSLAHFFIKDYAQIKIQENLHSW